MKSQTQIFTFINLKKQKRNSQEPLADIHFHLIETERGAMTVS